MGPDVECLIGELEQAEDTVCGWAARMTVPVDDAFFMENLKGEKPRLVLCRADVSQ